MITHQDMCNALCAKHKDLIDQRNQLFAVCKELQESASYWSEYDVPLGIVDRINAAIEKAEGSK